MAFRLVAPGAVLSHESAAVVHGLPVFGEPRDIHVHDPGRTRTKRVGDVILHASENEREIVTVDGGPVTSMTDTAVDLGRVLSPAFALALWDRAMRWGVARDALAAAWHRQRNSRGTRALSWLTDTASPLPESPGESVSRAVIGWLGFPDPALQQTFFWEDRHDRPDFYWPHVDVAGEFDGWAKYDMVPGRTPMAVLRAEKVREDRLRRNLRGVARWTFADVMSVTPLRDALRSAGLRETMPPNDVSLATLTAGWKRNTHIPLETPR